MCCSNGLIAVSNHNWTTPLHSVFHPHSHHCQKSCQSYTVTAIQISYRWMHRFKHFDHMYPPINHVCTATCSFLYVPLVALFASDHTILTKNHQLGLPKTWIMFGSSFPGISELQSKNFTIHNLYFSQNLNIASHTALQDHIFTFIQVSILCWLKMCMQSHNSI